MRRMSILTVGLAIVGALVLFSGQVGTALADKPVGGVHDHPGEGQGPGGSGNGGGGTPHGAFGLVSGKTGADPHGGGTDLFDFTLTDRRGNATLVHVFDTTKCKVEAGPADNAQCGEIIDGDYVAVQGTPADEGELDARRVNLARGRSIHYHCVGTIPAGGLDVADELTVECRGYGAGGVRSETFDISDAKIRPEGTTLSVEDVVTVVATRDGSAVTAKIVAVH